MKGRRFLDCRNVYSHQRVAEFGFAYRSFGRPQVSGDGVSGDEVTA
jgi:hypothetical protein